MTKKNIQAFTLIEMLVVIAIIATIAAFALPAITGAMTRGQLVQAVSNARQIYLSTFTMATDGTQTGEPKYGWPGDLADPTKPANVQISTVSQFVQRLVDNDYLKPGDLKVFAASGVTPWSGTYAPPADANSAGVLNPTFNGNTNCAFKVYKVKESDASDYIFLATKNFSKTGNSATAVSTTTTPFGDKGFIVFHKGGDGTFYKRQQSTSSNLGTVPNHQNPTDNEANTDYLTQQ
jgi:prepilin-type N-terminal cleavage/methylation domain-containing protein